MRFARHHSNHQPARSRASIAVKRALSLRIGGARQVMRMVAVESGHALVVACDSSMNSQRCRRAACTARSRVRSKHTGGTSDSASSAIDRSAMGGSNKSAMVSVRHSPRTGKRSTAPATRAFTVRARSAVQPFTGMSAASSAQKCALGAPVTSDVISSAGYKRNTVHSETGRVCFAARSLHRATTQSGAPRRAALIRARPAWMPSAPMVARSACAAVRRTTNFYRSTTYTEVVTRIESRQVVRAAVWSDGCGRTTIPKASRYFAITAIRRRDFTADARTS